MHTQDSPLAEAERDMLVAALRERGIRYLAPSDPQAGDAAALAPQELIADLAAQTDTRLRLSLIPLFILYPEWSDLVPRAAAQLDGPVQTELMACYTAAVYLQRQWNIRLGLYLPAVSALPDWFSERMGLPSPEERHGKVGLHALADWHAAHSPYPFNWLASYQRVMEQLFDQLKQEARQREHASPR
jgi:hypothetical protein